MTHKPITTLAVFTLLLSCMAIRAGGQEKGLDSLRAFHTRKKPSPVGHSDHMADKQNRHCRYPCVDVSYKNLRAGQWTDEYPTHQLSEP